MLFLFLSAYLLVWTLKGRYWVDFINIFARLFCFKNRRGFAYGKWQTAHRFGKFGCSVWSRMLVKLNSKFFAKHRALASFRLAKKFGEIDPWKKVYEDINLYFVR
jgi:hypothetical protein